MAAGATYEPIATTTLSSAASSITFSSIPSTYTDLRIVLVSKANTGTVYNYLRFNSDTGTNYSRTVLTGTGSTVGSSGETNMTALYSNDDAVATTYPALNTWDIFSYTGSTYKTVLLTYEGDKNGSGYVQSEVGLWRSTAAINTILVHSNGTYATGTTATLYGIKAA